MIRFSSYRFFLFVLFLRAAVCSLRAPDGSLAAADGPLLGDTLPTIAVRPSGKIVAARPRERPGDAWPVALGGVGRAAGWQGN